MNQLYLMAPWNERWCERLSHNDPMQRGLMKDCDIHASCRLAMENSKRRRNDPWLSKMDRYRCRAIRASCPLSLPCKRNWTIFFNCAESADFIYALALVPSRPARAKQAAHISHELTECMLIGGPCAPSFSKLESDKELTCCFRFMPKSSWSSFLIIERLFVLWRRRCK